MKEMRRRCRRCAGDQKFDLLHLNILVLLAYVGVAGDEGDESLFQIIILKVGNNLSPFYSCVVMGAFISFIPCMWHILVIYHHVNMQEINKSISCASPSHRRHLLQRH